MTITIPMVPAAGVVVPAIPEPLPAPAQSMLARPLPASVGLKPPVALLLPRAGCQLALADGDWQARWVGADPPGLATALLWGSRHALTAGHCLRSVHTFGGSLEAAETLLLAGPSLSPEALLAGHWQPVGLAMLVSAVEAGAFDARHPAAGDWALLSMTCCTPGAVVNESSLPLAPVPRAGDDCWRLGPGLRMPGAAETTSNAGHWVVAGEQCPVWLARLDSAPGLSGSPVVDASGRLAGLLLGRVGQAGDWYRRFLPGAERAGTLAELARVMPASRFAGMLPGAI